MYFLNNSVVRLTSKFIKKLDWIQCVNIKNRDFKKYIKTKKNRKYIANCFLLFRSTNCKKGSKKVYFCEKFSSSKIPRNGKIEPIPNDSRTAQKVKSKIIKKNFNLFGAEKNG